MSLETEKIEILFATKDPGSAQSKKPLAGLNELGGI